ncbi:MAG: hypothetical protein GYB58_16720 [Gammaproteobacteria bacterium]|nr:hypothetical protein [Gammaproteobacteria bacterium]
MKKWIAGFTVLWLAGCSSKPIGLNYYMLHEPTLVAAESSIDITNQPTIFLRTLSAPDYLKQRNLSLQLSDSEIHFAPKHVWAEPFDRDFKMALSESLSADHKMRLRMQSKWTNPAQPEYILDIQLDDFIPTYDGRLVLKGKFRLEKDGMATQIIQFNYLLPLNKDGFAYSVSQMRKLIEELTNDVVTRVEAGR